MPRPVHPWFLAALAVIPAPIVPPSASICCGAATGIASDEPPDGTCSGSAGCRVCSDCSLCVHCMVKGGGCGVCKPTTFFKTRLERYTERGPSGRPVERTRIVVESPDAPRAATSTRSSATSSPPAGCHGGSLCLTCPPNQHGASGCKGCSFCRDESRGCAHCPPIKRQRLAKFVGPPRPFP